MQHRRFAPRAVSVEYTRLLSSSLRSSQKGCAILTFRFSPFRPQSVSRSSACSATRGLYCRR